MIEFLVERKSQILSLTAEHLGIALIALFISIIIGVPLGIYLTRKREYANSVIGACGVVQTIPSLALLGFLLPFVGIGETPALIALVLYSLLPIVRNTYVGIDEVDDAITEAAKGMGMSDGQVLSRIELPLAIPTIFAGIQTSAVLNVGLVTICALVGAGGLGELIFQGIQLDNQNLILAGAIPAAILALALDLLLNGIQKSIHRWFPLFLKIFAVASLVGLLLFFFHFQKGNQDSIRVGFPQEFVGRPMDGYQPMRDHYGFGFSYSAMDPALMYKALKEKKVDLICGYTTDGRIKAYDLVVLDDDKNFFPPYHCAYLLRSQILAKYPQLEEILGKVQGKLTDDVMTNLNYRVDFLKLSPKQVAREFLESLNLPVLKEKRTGSPDIVLGWKSFTEQYILSEIFAQLVEGSTELTVELKSALGGTKIAFEALRKGDIDAYPEYTGTGLLVTLKPSQDIINGIIRNQKAVYDYVKEEFSRNYDLHWTKPLGFNNSYDLMMRSEHAAKLGITKISDLKKFAQPISAQ